MKTINTNQELEFQSVSKSLLITSVNAALSGGKEIMDVYASDFIVETKKDTSPLTMADRNCNDIIEKILRDTNLPILSEEGSKISYEIRKDWTFFWLVDPLDGTKEFVKRNGEFTVNIALIHKDTPVLGVIYVPVKQELYFGMSGLGSYKKTKIMHTIKDFTQLISNTKKLPVKNTRDTYTIVGSRSHMSNETEYFFQQKKKMHNKIDILSVGSSLKLCMVAEGNADSYPRYAPTMEWDTAAGHAIVKFAGFKVYKYNSEQELNYNKKNLLNPWFLVE